MLRRLARLFVYAFLLALVLVIGRGVVFIAYSLTAGLPINFFTGFEDADLPEVHIPFAAKQCCEHSITIVDFPVLNGHGAGRFHVLKDDPFTKKAVRAELRSRAALRGRDYWYAFNIFIPSPWIPSDNQTVLAQWHDVADRIIGEENRIPPLVIKKINHELIVELHIGRRAITLSPWIREPDYSSSVLFSEDIVLDKWMEMIVFARWTPRDDGRIEIWKDRKKIVDYTGPTMHLDLIGPYFNFGVYPPRWGKASEAATGEAFRTAFFDDVYTRDGSFSYDTFLAAYAEAKRGRPADQ